LNSQGKTQAGLSQQSLHRALDFVIAGSCDGRPGYQDDVPSRCYTLASQPHNLTQSALDPVADDGLAHPPADRKSKPADGLIVGQRTEYKEAIGPADAFTTHLLETPALAQPEIPLQRLPRPLSMRQTRGQLPAAALATPLEHVLTVLGAHALTKAMNAQATARLRLIRSLGH
jgi:hypothetical protein